MGAEVFDHVSGRLSERDAEIVAHVPPGGNWRDLPEDFESRRVDQIRRSAAAGEGSRSTYYGRLSASRPSYTISTYFNRPGNGCFIHPSAPRLITIREAARLQAFPDGFRFAGRGRSRFLQVGNAVPPLLAFQIAAAMGLEEGSSIVDLFSGAGGLGLGFEWAGHRLVASVDNDASCIKTQIANGSAADRSLLRDLGSEATLRSTVADIIELNGSVNVDALIGGPPCQGFSTAGHNQLDDPRNRLVGVFLEAVAALRPRIVLMENVPALGFRRSKATLQALLDALASLGYETETAVLHAEGYGVPQLRRRLFVQARRDEVPVSWPKPSWEILRPHQLASQPFGSSASRSRKSTSVSEALSDLPIEPSSDPDKGIDYGSEPCGIYQRWIRNLASIQELVGTAGDISLRQAA